MALTVPRPLAPSPPGYLGQGLPKPGSGAAQPLKLCIPLPSPMGCGEAGGGTLSFLSQDWAQQDLVTHRATHPALLVKEYMKTGSLRPLGLAVGGGAGEARGGNAPSCSGSHLLSHPDCEITARPQNSTLIFKSQEARSKLCGPLCRKGTQPGQKVGVLGGHGDSTQLGVGNTLPQTLPAPKFRSIISGS